MRSGFVCTLAAAVCLALPASVLAQDANAGGVPPAGAEISVQAGQPSNASLARTRSVQTYAYGQPDYNDYIAFYYGVNFGGDLFSAGPFESFDLENPKALGVAVGFWGSGILSGELDFCYSPEFFGPEEIVSDNNLMSVTASFVINPTIRFGSQKIRPYVLVGGGLMRTRIEDFDVFGADVRNQGVVDVGGGLQYYFHPRVGLRGDLRYFKGVGANDDDDGWGWVDNFNYFRATAGIAFTF